MKKISKKYFKSLLAAMLPMAGFAQEIILENSLGDNYVVEIDSSESFLTAIESINKSLADVEDSNTLPESIPVSFKDSFRMDLMFSEGEIIVKASKKANLSPRNYFAPVTPQDRADISEIVKTLANSSLVRIKGSESSLKRAGDRIDPIHPLQFLTVVFTDEELKVCMRNLQGRSWVWKRFLDGITETLAAENAVNNVMPYAQDFANHINLNIHVFLPVLQSGKWEKFINTLIDNVPRQGGSNRYDM